MKIQIEDTEEPWQDLNEDVKDDIGDSIDEEYLK